MEDLVIRLSTIDDVKEFVKIVSNFDDEVILKSGRYVVDAKSILGIFSIDLSKPIIVSIENSSEEKRLAIEKYIVK